MAAVMAGTDYYIPAAALGLAFIARAPGLRRGWRDPMMLSVCALILAASCGFFFAAPPTVEVINRWTGVTNISAPLVYTFLTAFSCASIVLIISWRPAPPDVTRRSIRRWVAGYAAVIIATWILFALGDAPDERKLDFDTFYTGTPFIREMITLYLLEHIVAAAIICVMCWRWAHEVRAWLRAGLCVLVAGFAFNLAFGGLKLAAVLGRWMGADLDVLSTDLAPPAAACGALLSTIGFLTPLLGPRAADTCRAWRTYRTLGSLSRALEAADPKRDADLKLPLLAGVQRRLIFRETRLYDRLYGLAPWLVGPAEEATTAAEAARMIADAIRFRASELPPTSAGNAYTHLAVADLEYLAQVSRAYAGKN
ncbi:hypothetical protein ABT024_05255 [Streptomyces sp. NPDC002812]|uniref:hypothetical protein n=1 Tax=Streptomyces sp. NPDC002812 TaxID=3154434 RepID=UPI003332B85E